MTDAAIIPEPIVSNVGGARVTISQDAPSDTLQAAARQEATVTDTLGRSIKLTKPSVLAQFHLIEALGNTASNQTYMAMVLPMLFVASIDGTPVVRPGTKAEVETLIQRLDEEGLTAVMKGVSANFGLGDEDVAKNG